MRPLLAYLSLSAIMFVVTSNAEAAGRVIHKERSLYQTLLVTQEGQRVCLKFSVRRDQRNQSCFEKNRPLRMVFPYTRMMMAALLLNPQPKRALVVGLGGGTLPIALANIYPEIEIDAIEIDPAVIRVAEDFFNFTTNKRLRVHAQDARVFTKRALRRGDKYDLVILDAFNGEYIPEHLMTQEYLEETKALLSENGVVASNTFTISKLYDHESVTYSAVFGRFFNLKIFQSANRVILASNAPLPSEAALKERAQDLAPLLKAYEVPIESYAKSIDAGIDWDVSARPLTDQFSPANLLRTR